MNPRFIRLRIKTTPLRRLPLITRSAGASPKGEALVRLFTKLTFIFLIIFSYLNDIAQRLAFFNHFSFNSSISKNACASAREAVEIYCFAPQFLQ